MADDIFEDNDLLTAATIDLAESALLSATALGVQLDDDWYQITVSEGDENLVVNLTFTNADGDIDLALYDEFGNLFAVSGSTTDNESLDISLHDAGIYYIKVYFGDAGNSYDLQWSASGETPTTGDDLLVGTTGVDTINGGNGNDVIEGLGGNDNLDGGAGHDALLGDGGNDTLTGGTGNDWLDGGSGSNTCPSSYKLEQSTA